MQSGTVKIQPRSFSRFFEIITGVVTASTAIGHITSRPPDPDENDGIRAFNDFGMLSPGRMVSFSRQFLHIGGQEPRPRVHRRPLSECHPVHHFWSRPGGNHHKIRDLQDSLSLLLSPIKNGHLPYPRF